MEGILKRIGEGAEFTAHIVQYFVYFELMYDDDEDNTENGENEEMWRGGERSWEEGDYDRKEEKITWEKLFKPF